MNDPMRSDIFSLNDRQPTPKRGSLLIAKPSVDDYVFERSVIMLVDPDEGDGAMGVVTNRLTGLTLADVLPEIETPEEIPVYLGGPVGHSMLFFLHTLGPQAFPECEDLGNGVYFGGKFEAVKAYLELGEPTEGKIKFIVGYSGWGANQLADELERHDWAVWNGDIDHSLLMDTDDSGAWKRAVQLFGDRYRLWLTIPHDPSNN